MRFLILAATTLVALGGCKKDDDETDTVAVDTDTDTDVTVTDTLTETDTVDTVETDTVETDTVDSDTDAIVKFDVVLDGTGFDAFEGKSVAMAIHDLAKYKLAGFEFGPVTNGEFSLTASQKVIGGLEYAVDYFVDANANMLCDAEDAAFHLEIPAVTADVVLNVTFDAADVDLVACKAF